VELEIGGGQYRTVVWNISQNECKEAAEMTETLGVLWSCFSLVPVSIASGPAGCG
jgi:hypothetical protein